MRWQRKGRISGPGEDRRLTNQNTAWASESLCLKWWVEVRAWVNQFPNHLTTWEGWKDCPSTSMRAVEGGSFGLGFAI